MKLLVLHCDCGHAQAFTGPNAQTILEKIIAAGWAFTPDDIDSGLGKGQAPGICPSCCEALPDPLAPALDAKPPSETMIEFTKLTGGRALLKPELIHGLVEYPGEAAIAAHVSIAWGNPISFLLVTDSLESIQEQLKATGNATDGDINLVESKEIECSEPACSERLIVPIGVISDYCREHRGRNSQ